MLNVVVIIVHLSLLLLALSYLSHIVDQGRPSLSEHPLQGYQVLPILVLVREVLLITSTSSFHTITRPRVWSLCRASRYYKQIKQK